MTTTAITSAQSVGTVATNAGEGKLISKTTLQATTTAFVVSARITNGAAGYSQNDEIIVRYTSTSWSYSANSAAVAALRGTSRFVDVKLKPNNGDVQIKESSLEPVTGGDVFVWVDIPTFANGVAATLDINLVELP